MPLKNNGVTMLGESLPPIPELSAGLVLALLGIAFGIQKLIKNWKSTGAETSIITLMHQELERMSAQNTLLATELNKLQLEILHLTKELNTLTLENQKLRDEIISLNKEITRLQYAVSGHLEESAIVGET